MGVGEADDVADLALTILGTVDPVTPRVFVDAIEASEEQFEVQGENAVVDDERQDREGDHQWSAVDPDVQRLLPETLVAHGWIGSSQGGSGAVGTGFIDRKSVV